MTDLERAERRYEEIFLEVQELHRDFIIGKITCDELSRHPKMREQEKLVHFITKLRTPWL